MKSEVEHPKEGQEALRVEMKEGQEALWAEPWQSLANLKGDEYPLRRGRDPL